MVDHQIYCICCGTLTPLEEAKQVFHTGYYKCVYRLGQCKDCQCEEDNASPNASLMHNLSIEETYPIVKLEDNPLVKGWNGF